MSASNRRFILASGSPRRRELLKRAGFHFEVLSPEIDEQSPSSLTVREITCWNALRKGLAIARAHPEAVVLAADTLVALDREIFGKPADLAEAQRMLARLSGRQHIVASGVFLAHLASGRSESFTIVSRVSFRRWDRERIDSYLSAIEPLDKAGAYAAQGRGRAIVARIAGSRTNVIGLPMEKTRAALERFGVRARA